MGVNGGNIDHVFVNSCDDGTDPTVPGLFVNCCGDCVGRLGADAAGLTRFGRIMVGIDASDPSGTGNSGRALDPNGNSEIVGTGDGV